MSAEGGTAQAIQLLLAVDQSGARAATREVLAADGFQVVGEATDGEEAIRLCEEHRPDLVVIDVDLPGGGIRAADEVKRRQPQTSVVMLAATLEDDDLFDSLRAGAAGCLPKDIDPRALAAALRGVLAGEAALSRRMVTRVLDEFRSPSKRRFDRTSVAATRLSPREWEIMQLLSSGKSTDQVARQLFLSPTTVRVHVSAAMKKLHVEDRESALRLLRGE